MVNKFKIDIKEFQKLHRKDVCSGCPKRLPCAAVNSICELITPCQICEMREKCYSLCPQMEAYLQRGVKGLPNTISFNENIRVLPKQESVREQKMYSTDIPWPAIPERDREIITDHFKESMTYSEVAKKHGISKGRAYKIIHGYGGKRQGAIAILRKYKEYQGLYKKYGKYIPQVYAEILKEYFVEYKTLRRISQTKQETKRATEIRFKKAKQLIDKFK